MASTFFPSKRPLSFRAFAARAVLAALVLAAAAWTWALCSWWIVDSMQAWRHMEANAPRLCS